MFSKKITDSDAFLDMPAMARLLYYDLSMSADDDGFNSAPKRTLKTTGAQPEDLRALVENGFIIPFENGVVAIRHWRVHNQLRKDRHHNTTYTEQLAKLDVDENNIYQLKAAENYLESGNHLATTWQPDGNHLATEVRIGKVSIGQDRVGAASPPRARVFIPPTLEDVKAYVAERKSPVDPQGFIDFYASKGWMVGKSKMKDWKAACRNAEKWDRWAKRPVNTRVRSEEEYTKGGDFFGT